MALRLTVNAVNLAPGGGLTGLIGYLRAWRETGADLDITLFASRPRVLDEVREASPDLDLRPFGVGASLPRRFALQQLALGRAIVDAGSDVVMTTNMLVAGCRVPQIAHHRNLLLLERHGLLANLRQSRKLILQQRYATRALAQSAANVFISDYMRRMAESIVPTSAPRNTVIHNGLAERVIEASQQPSTWNGEPYLAAITSEEPYPGKPYKDNVTLIRCLAELIAREPDVPWRLGVASGGELRDERALARKLGVAEHIDWLGFLRPEGLDRLLRKSLCLLYTSLMEGFGNPPLEAMARRCAVIASDCTAIPEVVGDAGILAEPGSPGAFADAVQALRRKPQRRDELIALGLRRIGCFRWNESAKRFYELARQVAATGRG